MQRSFSGTQKAYLPQLPILYIVIKSNTYPMSGGRKHHLPSKCHWDD